MTEIPNSSRHTDKQYRGGLSDCLPYLLNALVPCGHCHLREPPNERSGSISLFYLHAQQQPWSRSQKSLPI
jgi:hypothetical protein